MKSIAEYFRDLAADDRYFGAEPPTPDAEMLHRIAEREIHKRVEARVENDEVVLRQADADAPRIKPAAATLIPGETLLDQVEAPTEAAATFTPAEPIESTEKALDSGDLPTDDMPADSIAAKLQRIRAVVDRGHEDHTGEYVEDQHADAFFADAEASLDDVQVDAKAEINTDSQAEFDAVPDDAEMAPDRLEEDDLDTDDLDDSDLTDADEPDADDLRAEEEDEAEIESDNAIEAEIDNAPEADFDTDDAQLDDEVEAISDALDDAEADDAAYDETYEDEADGDDATLAALLGSISDEAPVADEAEEEFVAKTEKDDAIDSVLAGLVAEDEQVDESALADEIDEDDDIALGDDIDAIADEEDENVFAEDDTPRPVAIARVVKVKRADLEPVEKQDNEDSLLTPEEEADLMAELAEVERDATDEDEQTGQRPAFEDAGFDESDVAVDRILAETNTKMESTEVSRRRSAIAHLKAAVQAKRADDEAGETPDDDDTESYRGDLARVVRPRRLGGNGDKHASRRLAPLMLVSEQRIDAPEAEADAQSPAVVRPRRVTKGNLALEAEQAEAEAQVEMPDNSDDFATYAEQRGAESMSELLEAAAAFATQVEGRPHFARPQIMKQVLAYDPEGTFSREEGLRAFGKLLREGRFKKIKRGQFVITEATRSDPEVRRESA
ncbi:hypothetical protein [Aliiroseovarius subalbicans]|uniref:hypothetical protein n=1 Tax=Aliiroseovarius subalbicans TaxID=2925840 RepID=UPI001F597A19|nr:hypothetical protein [Aliiroseovarius subalbicans]MCI2397909.1 hypothetical protein [Aliiroseovarius subalbicans]